MTALSLIGMGGSGTFEATRGTCGLISCLLILIGGGGRSGAISRDFGNGSVSTLFRSIDKTHSSLLTCKDGFHLIPQKIATCSIIENKTNHVSRCRLIISIIAMPRLGGAS